MKPFFSKAVIVITVVLSIAGCKKENLKMEKRFYSVPPFTYEEQLFDHRVTPQEAKIVAGQLLYKYPQYDSVLVNRVDEPFAGDTYTVTGNSILIFYFYGRKKSPSLQQFIELTNDVSHLGGWTD